jgi:uncharacterized repeat protein (TIGR03803 family)
MQVRAYRVAHGCLQQILSLGMAIAGLAVGVGAHASNPVLKTLYTFCELSMCADGYQPRANVILDNRGNLYGTTYGYDLAHGYGNVYELSPPSPGKTKWIETSLHDFTYTNPNDGADPAAGVIFDMSGNLYGTTVALGYIEIHGKEYSGGGTVFELSPPAGGKGAWIETILHPFPCACELNRDGSAPYAGVVFHNGSLYGTTIEGGTAVPGAAQFGTIFQVSPPVGTKTNWTETLVHDFKGGKDGATPSGGVLFDKSGNLYGLTAYGGSTYPVNVDGEVFKLTPPAIGEKAWRKTALYTFTGGQDGGQPAGDLIADELGNLYGTANKGGVFCDSDVPAGCGVVLELSPPAKGETTWSETVLYSFRGGQNDGILPTGGLVRDGAGNLYGVTIYGGNPACTSSNYFSGCGAVFKLSPPPQGTTIWTETILYVFTGGSDGGHPLARLTLDDKGNIYGTTQSGASSDQPGTVFMITGAR